MIYLILGYDNDNTVYEAILGMMEGIFPHSRLPPVQYCYAKYLVDAINDQLCKFSVYKYFRYQSYLVYLLLFYQAPNFEHLHLNRFYDKSNPLLVTEWTPLVRKHLKMRGFQTLIDESMYTVHITSHGDHSPRMPLECNKLLQLSVDIRVGDWYLCKDYTILRIYGSEVNPIFCQSTLHLECLHWNI